MLKQCFIIFVFCSLYAFGQTSGDQIAFKKAMSAPTDSARLEEINKFIAENPTSNLLPNAYAVKFQIYANMKNDSGAYFSVKKYLSILDQSQLVPALNAVAFEFAQRMLFIDSAAVMIDSAITLYKKEEPVLLNTKGLILFRLKRYSEALKTQERAVALLPENAKIDSRYVSLFVQLGFIQFESGLSLQGMQKIILGNLVLPREGLPVDKVDSLLATKNIDAKNISLIRDSLYRSAISEFLKFSSDSAFAKSRLAVSLALNNIFPELALQYGKEAYAAARSRTIEERSGASASLGLTNYHLQRYQDAERYLSEAAIYAPPNETEIFMTLGRVKELLGKKKEAFDAYLSGAMGSNNTSVYDKLIELKNELFPTISLDSIIVARQAAALQFTPEEYQRTKQVLKNNEFPRIVLAELFTGSECRPCQAADVAFDYLIDRFKTSSLAILEYHQHIPLPDPLVNADTEKRAKYYGISSTPTAVFNGRTVITSGGSRVMAKNKFFLYADIIEKEIQKPASVTVALTASLKNNIVTVKAKALSTEKNINLKVRIALVEDEVQYKGSNGIERHKFVVRKMIKSVEGYSFPKDGKLTVSQTVNLQLLRTELEAYYEKTKDRFSKLGTSLKEKKTHIDPNRLAVVLFVQDDATREILQATTVKVE